MECLFCKIVKEKNNLTAKKEVYLVGENEEVIAILDKFPASDEVISKLAAAFKPAGFNIISNMEKIAAQSIFHLHIHIIPKYVESEGFI
ncbi:7608_t:CDS:2 [Funneliformis geosporum]|nr:7608_t:CDS:2 [Funneliformis geosporum]